MSPAGRLLLMRFEDETIVGAATSGWCTAGGGVDDGETFEDAARREAFEETGHTEVVLGPKVWIRELDLMVEGEPRRLIEHYFMAYVPHEELSSDGWTALERRVVRTMRWWRPEDIADSDETIFPNGLGAQLLALLRDGPPDQPLRIEHG
jgi:8-oxo-dGTP pyrophosphatase MutT (NUDIX family)